jgi:hypothetical protein
MKQTRMKSKVILGMIVLALSTVLLSNCKDDEITPPALITSVSPEEGHIGEVVTISGKHFTSGSEIFFNSVPAVITSITENEILVTVPEGAATGSIAVVADGKSTLSTNAFTVLHPPVISAFAPQTGGVGSSVTITGTNFSAVTNQNTVTFNGITAPVTASSATQLTVTVPQTATGKIAVSVKGKSFTTNEDFTIVPTNEWQSVADFSGPGRYYAVGFSIGTKGYVGTGRRPGGVKAKDLWEFNSETGAWTQKADLPATGRENAVGFAIGTKGYIGTGTTGLKQKDMWEYDPTQNQWTPKDDFGGGDRENATVFVVGTKAYVGLGVHGDQHERMRDLWEFNPMQPAGQQWTQRQNVGGTDYASIVSGLPPASFTIGEKGYVAIPLSNGSLPDFWEFNPVANTWSPKAKTPVDISASSQAVSFVLHDKGYMLSGAALWRYDASSNTWLQKANFPLANIRYASGFSISNLGYAGLGYTTGESLKVYKYYPD